MAMNNKTINVENTNTEKKLSKKDLSRLSWRAILGSQLNWNYERMMGSGYLYSVLPMLEKLYGDNPEQLKEMMKTHNQFFNTNAIFMNLIIGIDAAIEEEEGYKSRETVASLKTSLMGSLAGVGDSIQHVIWGTVFGSIAAVLAKNGSAAGCIIWMIANVFLMSIRYLLTDLGYKQGIKLITILKDKLQAFTDAATVLGVTVIGALIPTVINAKTDFIFINNGVELNLQETLNSIMPALIPVLLVLLTYWMLGRKNLNSTRVIWIILIFSIVLSGLGILA